MAFPAFLKKGKGKAAGKKAPGKKSLPPQFKKKSAGSQAMALEERGEPGMMQDEAGEPPAGPPRPMQGGFPFKKGK